MNGTVQTYLDGHLFDVDNLTVEVQLSLPGGIFEGSWLNVTNLSEGTYGFSYPVPENLNESGIVWFYANAESRSFGGTIGLPNLPSLHIDVANPFLIWTHQIALTQSDARFEVWVADAAGSPEVGATVWVVTVPTGPSSPAEIISGRALTDGAGRASFDLAMHSSVSPQYLYFRGHVTNGSANESFDGSLVSTQTQTSGFTLQRDNPLDLFQPGEKAVLNYTADFGGTALAGALILYTVYNTCTLLAYGRITTDASGRFGIQFTTPSDGATIDLATLTPDGVWNGGSFYVPAVERLNVQVGTLQVGTTGHVIVYLPASEGPWYVSIAFYASNTSAPADSSAGWNAEGELSGVGLRLGAQSVEGPIADLSLPLPSFLPANRPYYLQILAYAYNAVTPFGAFPGWYAFAALVTVQPAPIDVGLLLVVTLPILVVAATATLAVVRRRIHSHPPQGLEEPRPPPPD